MTTAASRDALRVRGACRRLDGRTVLNGIDLEMSKGTILGLVGPNGAGKTSLLRAVSGRLRVDSGTIEIQGLRPQQARRRGHLGVVPQEIALYAHLTVRENLAVLGRLAGVPARDVKTRVDEGLEWAGLADRAAALVPTLSGGMRRRVNLVASTLHRPDLLLLDEPTVGVDAEARARLHDLLLALRGQGVGLLIATHDLDEATRLCDEVAVLSAGSVLMRGSVAELIERVLGSRPQMTITIAVSSDRARDLLQAEGFLPIGEQQWTTSRAATLGEAAAIERRLAAAGIELVETRVSAATLAGAIAALTRKPAA